MSYLDSIANYEKNRQIIEICFNEEMMDLLEKTIKADSSFRELLSFFIFQGDAGLSECKVNRVLLRVVDAADSDSVRSSERSSSDITQTLTLRKFGSRLKAETNYYCVDRIYTCVNCYPK